MLTPAVPGRIRIEEYEAEPEPLAFSIGEDVSVTFDSIRIVMSPVWVPVLMASKLSFKVL
jgi:hypothetical protein